MRLPDAMGRAQMPVEPAPTRAMDTARLLGLDPKPEPRLIEMAWGEWEGKSLEDLRAELRRRRWRRTRRRGLDFRPPGGESPRDVQERLRPLLSEA